MDPEKLASMKRFFSATKDTARGFKRDAMKRRLAPTDMSPEGADQLDTEPDPMDPNEPAEIAAGEPPEDMDAAAKLQAIKKLIEGV